MCVCVCVCVCVCMCVCVCLRYKIRNLPKWRYIPMINDRITWGCFWGIVILDLCRKNLLFLISKVLSFRLTCDIYFFKDVK